MPLQDMKSKPRESKDTLLAEAAEDYPYGLKLNLEEEEIEKLGMDKMPSPGVSIGGDFVGTVERAAINKGPDGTRRSLCIQIKKLGLGKEVKEDDGDEIKKPKEIPNKPTNDGPSVSKVLYGD